MTSILFLFLFSAVLGTEKNYADDLPGEFIIRMFDCPRPREECEDKTLDETSKAAIREIIFPEIDYHLESYNRRKVAYYEKQSKKLESIKDSFESCYEFLSLDERYEIRNTCDTIIEESSKTTLRDVCCESCENHSIKEVTDFPVKEDDFPLKADVQFRFLSGSYWTNANGHFSYGKECGAIFAPSKVELVGGDCNDVSSLTNSYRKKFYEVSIDEVRQLRKRMHDDSEFEEAYKQKVAKYLKFLDMETHGSVTEEFCTKYKDLVGEAFSPSIHTQNVLQFCKEGEKVLSQAEFLKLVGTEFEECKKRVGYKSKGAPAYKHNEVVFAPPKASHLGFFVHHHEYYFENGYGKQEYNEECKRKVRSVVSMKNLFNKRTGRDVNALMCNDFSCLKFMNATEENCDLIFKPKVYPPAQTLLTFLIHHN